MKSIRLLELVYNQPLLITEEAFWSIHRLIESHVLGTAEQRERSAMYCGDKVALPSMVMEDGIAQIPIGGVMGQKLGDYAKMAGAVSMEDILADIDEAEADETVHTILLDWDSPGGTYQGTGELAARVAEIQKPKFSFSQGTIASAAYYVACSTDGIFLTGTARAGSIGTVLTYLDMSEAYKQEGLRVQMVKAGRYKGMGTPGTSLSDDHLALLQQQINEINGEFRDHVRARRPDVQESAMEGQGMFAKAALQAGLIDGIVRDKAEVLRMLKRE